MTHSLDRAHELLRKASGQFRAYESLHRAKLDNQDLSLSAQADTLAKAEVNAALAFEIEKFLAQESPA